jgi:hypothetical protein
MTEMIQEIAIENLKVRICQDRLAMGESAARNVVILAEQQVHLSC